MINHPFSSINTNFYDEKTRNSTPANLYGQNVLVNQEQHQKFCNTLATSISGMPSAYSYPQQFQPHNPNCVTYTFGGNQICPYHTQPQDYYQNLQQLQQRNALDLMQLQSQMNQPYQEAWKFHLDNQTSTSDLRQLPSDLNNLVGYLGDSGSTRRENPRKLIVRNVAAKLETQICNEIIEEAEKKKVSFELDGCRNAEIQVKLCCICCEHVDDCKNAAPKKERKKKKKVRSRSSSVSSSDEERARPL